MQWERDWENKQATEEEREVKEGQGIRQMKRVKQGSGIERGAENREMAKSLLRGHGNRTKHHIKCLLSLLTKATKYDKEESLNMSRNMEQQDPEDLELCETDASAAL